MIRGVVVVMLRSERGRLRKHRHAQQKHQSQNSDGRRDCGSRSCSLQKHQEYYYYASGVCLVTSTCRCAAAGFGRARILSRFCGPWSAFKLVCGSRKCWLPATQA